MKYIVVVCLFLMISVIFAQDYSPEFESDDCPYFMQQLADDADTSISCGYLHVPEDRDDIEGSLELELFVVRIESSQDNDTVPFVYLEGGPGGAASVSFDSWLESGIHQDYDIILIDQRGTGLSYPSLNCYELDEVDDDSWIEDCRKRLVDDEDIDLSAYNSANNAHDIHDLLIALNIDEANIYGSSYGVRLALTMARDFPDRIRTVLIDAVYPPQVDALVDEAFYGNQAIERIFADCSTDSACNIAYPNLRQSFYTAIENMNDDPPYIEDYELGYVVETTGDDFVSHIFSMLYDTEMLPYLPALINAYANGDYKYDPQFEAEQIVLEQSIVDGTIEPDVYDIAGLEYLEFDDVNQLYDYYESLNGNELNNLLDDLEDYIYYMPFRDYLEYDTIDETADYMNDLDDEEYSELEAEVIGSYDDDSEGMYMSVECSEEVHFNNEADVVAQSDGIPELVVIPLTDSAVEFFDVCDSWDVDKLGAIENEPVVSDIPTLILSGAYDPITPYQWGAETQSYLPNSWHYIFPNVGHGTLDTQDCANVIVLSFLANPLQQPSNVCLSELGAPQFYIRP